MTRTHHTQMENRLTVVLSNEVVYLSTDGCSGYIFPCNFILDAKQLSISCYSEILPSLINPEGLQNEPEQGSHYSQRSSLVATAGKAGAALLLLVPEPKCSVLDAPRGVVQNT